MNKTNVILKKAILFEKLSKCESKQAMLKIFAEDTLNSLIYEINKEIDSLTSVSGSTHPNIPYLEQNTEVKDILSTLTKMLNYNTYNTDYVSKNRGDNDYILTLIDRVEKLDNDRVEKFKEFDNLTKEPKQVTSEQPTTSYEAGRTTKNITPPNQSTSEMNKYFMMIQNGKKLLNSIDLADLQKDYKPRFDQLAADLMTFKQYFYKEISRPGEAQTLAARADSLLSEHDRLAPKMQEASRMQMSNPTA